MFLVKTKEGKDWALLNPSEKAKKYARELKEKKKYTNTFILNTDEKGKPLSFKHVERYYRTGYLNARKDSANCFTYLRKKGK